MTQFFFDIVSPDGGRWDEIGTECVDREDAQRIAQRTIFAVAADETQNADVAAYKIRVRACDGYEIYAATLTFTVSATRV